MTILEQAVALKDTTIALRRDLHRHPELGFEETRTAGIVAERLQAAGIDVTTGIGGTGVVGLLRDSQDKPVVLMRFDMDALPIQEQTGVAYASEIPGKMHACGHDSHVAIGLTVASLLSQRRSELPGTIKFVFQPAEEGGGGAQRMVAEGVLAAPTPDYALGVHVWNEKEIGWYGLTDGPAMAGSHQFTVTLTGKGGHGAVPQVSADPIVAAAQIITALQTLVSRNVSPLESAVVSVCQIEAGTAFNIIPQEAAFSGTIRTFKPEIFQTIERRFRTLVEKTAEAMGCLADMAMEMVTLPVINDTSITHLMAGRIKEIDPSAKIDHHFQTMGSEDFSFMMDGIPGCFMFVGSANHEKGLKAGHHHPEFNIDEDCMPYAVAALAEGAIELMKQHSRP